MGIKVKECASSGAVSTVMIKAANGEFVHPDICSMLQPNTAKGTP
jgi:hypothetical protein